MHIHKIENIDFRNLHNNEECEIVINNNIHHSTFTSTHNVHILYMASKHFGR